MKNLIIALITCFSVSAVAFAAEAPTTSAPTTKHATKMKKHKKHEKKTAAAPVQTESK